MRTLKKILAVSLILLLFLIMFPLSSLALDAPITTFEQLQTAVSTASGPTDIVVSADIAFTDAITILGGKEITIKSTENNNFILSVSGNFRHFVIEANASLKLENITLDGGYSANDILKGGGIENNGNFTLMSGAIITRCYDISGGGISNDEIINVDSIEIQETQSPESNSDIRLASGNVLDLGSLVVTWSGFALAALTLLAGIMGFFGFRELRDLQKASKELDELHLEFDIHVSKIAELEKSSEAQLTRLTKHFEDDAQTIMQATYFFTLGSNAYDEANYHDAIMYLKRSLKYLPQSTNTLCLMGRAYTIIENNLKSKECFCLALKIDPECSAAYRGLAAWHRHTDPEKALKYAKIAVEKDPDDYELLNYLGQLLRDNALLQEAMQAHMEANSLRKHPDTDFFLSILFAAEASLGRARVHIQNSIDQYENEEEFSRSKPVWKALAHWVSILVSDDRREERSQQALLQLDEVAKCVDTKRTRTVVLGHIRFLLSAFNMDQPYILESEGKFLES